MGEEEVLLVRRLLLLLLVGRAKPSQPVALVLLLLSRTMPMPMTQRPSSNVRRAKSKVSVSS